MDFSRLVTSIVNDDLMVHNWTSKVARFLAYVIDGGILQSLFTLTSMVQMIRKVTDPKDERII